ncbi:maltokinase N-terminal cap-like domain-containing protein [Georgenia wangjunii]|uniref:maltokinase N-terminal cap-like domain-containing protein n=1 Tax=Georgenia wangjunii TaxID=3117730 RepID=UPI002F262B30
MASVTPPFGDFLPAWIGAQRWYAGKGSTPELTRVGGLRYEDPAGEVGIETWILRDTSGAEPVVYQVPLTYRGAPVDGLEHALVAQVEHSELGPRWVYDGCHDPVGARALVETILSEQAVRSDGAPGTGAARGHRAHGAGAVTGELHVRGSRVLSGEQSNTSIIVEATTADGAARPVICKVFRVLADGENPDVVVQEALAGAGCTLVPAPVGDLGGEWPTGSGTARGHLAFAQEFLPGVEDAWRVALRSATAGADFTDRARALGAAVAEVHDVMARTLEVREADEAARREVLDSWRERSATALREVPALAPHADAVRAVLEAAAAAPWPRLQRVHGDLHLGQVIDAPERGWVLLDFEGEPIRPLAERSAPDLALRDVAGMLRSFDYAAGSVTEPGVDAGAWAAAARDAFLAGYAEVSGRDPRADAALLTALELDKALYEAVYEVRNRPDWLHIPVEGALRLLAG